MSDTNINVGGTLAGAASAAVRKVGDFTFGTMSEVSEVAGEVRDGVVAAAPAFIEAFNTSRECRRVVNVIED